MDKKKLLIVDDHGSVRHNLGRMATNEGYEVQTASNGAEALELADQFRPDLIVLDIQLPSLDGFEVMEQMIHRKIVTRIIICSGIHKSIDDFVRGIRGGACDYAVKPISTVELFDKIKRHLAVDGTKNFEIARTPEPLAHIFAEDIERLEREVDSLQKKLTEIADKAKESDSKVSPGDARHNKSESERTHHEMNNILNSRDAFEHLATVATDKYNELLVENKKIHSVIADQDRLTSWLDFSYKVIVVLLIIFIYLFTIRGSQDRSTAFYSASVCLILLLVVPWKNVKHFSGEFKGAKTKVEMHTLKSDDTSPKTSKNKSRG